MRRDVGAVVALGAALLLAPAAPAADKAAIDRAVDRGATYLKSIQGQDGTWTYSPSPQIGATALCGLALVESGAKPDDPAVQKAAKAVREASIPLTRTYSLALSIMFLDRLGDPADAELIESMAVRLLAGQDPATGGWTYECPPLADTEVRRLQGSLQQRRELVAREAPPEAPERRATAQDLPKEIQEQLRLINRQAGTFTGQGTDNSNTQFAVLALWIARRKGIPVEGTLQRIDARFRPTQRPDGGWSYELPTPGRGGPPPGTPAAAMMANLPGMGSTGAMTCAGLLGLALSHGSAMETTLRTSPVAGVAPARKAAQDPGKDPAIRNGLVFLGKVVGKPFEEIDRRGMMRPPQAVAPPNGFPNAPGGGPGAQGGGRGYYFLFSLERMAVAYGLDTIGDKNWYDWGSDILLKNQNRDGSWTGDYAESGSDTCFAILFLRRANLAKDLSTTLLGQVKDPGQHQLRAVEDVDKGVGARPAPDAGQAPGNPKEARPAAPVDPEVARLSDELVKAEPGRQEQALEALRDGKGAVYTDALAHAIHRLDGAIKGKARDALADRLTRMKSATLADKLRDDDAEVRRAAALACAMKDDRANAPRLIELLQDPDPAAARAARAALKTLAGQDLGPEPASWKDWWSKNAGK
jgi:hypothetical protein